MEVRHEWKYEISAIDRLILRQRLSAVMMRDEHAAGGTYLVRSLYFDDGVDSALREKLDGVNCREKFRIRCYDHDHTVIHLEKKTKRNGLGGKTAVCLAAEEVQAITEGHWDWMRADNRPLVRELYGKMCLQGLRPRTIVDYRREPFVFGPGNVRVTIDDEIRTGLYATEFLDPGCVTVPVQGTPIVLEVKWDTFLPDVIRDLVQLEGRHIGAFSKYASCRMYD